MSLPEFPKPDPDLTQEQALTMILSSIAMEEAALSRIIDAEGDNIRHIFENSCGNCCDDARKVLEVNKSVSNLMEVVMENQIILKNKMNRVLERLSILSCTSPFTEFQCHPKPCHNREPIYSYSPKCGCGKPHPHYGTVKPVCFDAVSQVYPYGHPLMWRDKKTNEPFVLKPDDISKIQLPYSGWYEVEIFADIENLKYVGEIMELTIYQGDKPYITKKIMPNSSYGPSNCRKRLTIQIPSSGYPCYTSVIMCIQNESHIKRCSIRFTRL